MSHGPRVLFVLLGASACATCLAALFLAMGPPLAGAHRTDRDCPEFSSQAAAQRFFTSHGGSRTYDFDGLDGNGDGIACNDLPCPCSRADGGGEAADAVPPGHRIPARVTHVTDGDTIDVTFASGVSLAVRVIAMLSRVSRPTLRLPAVASGVKERLVGLPNPSF